MTVYQKADKYLPHNPPMMLLDEVLSVTDEQVICCVEVSTDGVLGPFLDSNHQLPAWFAIELMAQTIGVWSGWHAARLSASAKLGFLLGGRHCQSTLATFPCGSRLVIYANKVLQDQKLANFDCHIHIDNQQVAQAKLNVYQPDNDELQQLLIQEEQQ